MRWRKLSTHDKIFSGLGVGIFVSVVAAAVHELIWPSPPPTEEDKQKDKEFKRLKGKILRRARFRCENCGKKQEELDVYYIDKEGECTYDNLRVLCSCCKDS